MGVASRRPACPLARRNAASQTLLAGQRAYTTVSRRHEHPDLHTRWLGQVNTRNQRPAAVDESDVALLEGRSTSDVYDILASLRVRPGSYGKIVKLVDHLVYTRGVRLDAFLYETLLMANSDPQGSALAVKELVKGLESQGIQKTPTLYLAALRVGLTVLGKLCSEC